MAKPEWGKKRSCQSCGSRFYDLLRDPIVCPKCETVFDPLAALRPRRARVATAKAEPKKKALATASTSDSDDDDVLEDDDLDDIETDEDEDDSMIEDASELGEDDDDVGTVAVKDDDD